MSLTIRIRNVPERLFRRLKSLAAAAGMSLSDCLRLELARSAAQLTPEELMERLSGLDTVAMDESAADAVRAERDSR